MFHHAFLGEFLILFGLSIVAVLVFHRLRLPPVVGFLFTGVISGPFGLKLIDSVGEVESMAEIGVVLLLFTIGIEFSLKHLLRLRLFLLVGGALQVGVTMGATALVASALGQNWRVSVFLGMLVALSSTAIVLRLVTERGEMDAPHGRGQLAILIFQDLCIVPMMLLTPLIAGQGGGAGEAAVVALKALGFVALALVGARWAVPWLLSQVVGTRRREVFVLFIIFLCLGTAWASEMFGLSLALGAFIAGLVISESEYSHQALGDVLPFREVFNSLFFISIGMLLDVRVVIARPLELVGGVVFVVLLKLVVTTLMALALGQSMRVAIVIGLGLAQIGEFSFVLSRVGLSAGLLEPRLNQLFLTVAVASMALTPGLLAIGPRIGEWLDQRLPARLRGGRSSELADVGVDELSDHVLVIGYGVNGRNLARVLMHVKVPYVVIEMNSDTVRQAKSVGVPILYGDATRPEILEHAGVTRARVMVIAISDAAATRRSASVAAKLNPGLHVIVRSRYVAEIQPLLDLGAHEVVPEEFETSVEIFTRVLHQYLVPQHVVEGLIREVRSDGYVMLRGVDAERSAHRLHPLLHSQSLAVNELASSSSLVGQRLGASGLRRTTGVTVVAMQRADKSVVGNPTAEDKLMEGDLLLLLGKPEQLAAAARVVRPEDYPDKGRPRE